MRCGHCSATPRHRWGSTRTKSRRRRAASGCWACATASWSAPTTSARRGATPHGATPCAGATSLLALLPVLALVRRGALRSVLRRPLLRVLAFAALAFFAAAFGAFFAALVFSAVGDSGSPATSRWAAARATSRSRVRFSSTAPSAPRPPCRRRRRCAPQPARRRPVPRRRRRVPGDRVAEAGAGTERGHGRRRDVDGLPRARVAARPRGAGPALEHAEPGERHRVTGPDRVDDDLQQGVDGGGRGAPVAEAVGQRVHELGLVHGRRR